MVINKTYKELFLHEIMSSGKDIQNGHHKPKSSISLSYQDLLRQKRHSKQWKKNSFKAILIIILPTTNFSATFHRLYLPVVKSHSFQFRFPLFLFCVEHVEKGLRTMSNKDVNPWVNKGYYIEQNMTVHLLTTKCLHVAQNLKYPFKKSIFSEFLPVSQTKTLFCLCKAKNFISFFFHKNVLQD